MLEVHHHRIIAARVHGRGDADQSRVLDEQKRCNRFLEELRWDSVVDKLFFNILGACIKRIVNAYLWGALVRGLHSSTS